MSTLHHIGQSPGRPNSASYRRRLWRAVARALDTLFSYPTRHAVADDALRGTDRERARNQPLTPSKTLSADARLNQAALHHIHAMRIR